MIRKKSLLESFKCELVIALVLSIPIAALPNLVSVSANTDDKVPSGTCALEINDSDKDINVVGTNEEDGKIITTYNDGASSIEYEDGTIELIIPTSSSFITDEERELLQGVPGAIQPRGFFYITSIIVKIVSSVFLSCSVVNSITNGFDPCMAARQYLGKGGRSGKYVVQGNYIPGRNNIGWFLTNCLL